jgi:hypothetical protein
MSEQARGRLRAAAAASLAAALALIAGALATSFWRGGDGDTHYQVGLVRASICIGSACHDGGLSLFGAATATWAKLGAATLAAGMLAALAHLVAALQLVRPVLPAWAYRPRLAGGLSLLAMSIGAVFAISQPDLGLAAGPAMILFFGGAAVGVAAAVALHPAR